MKKNYYNRELVEKMLDSIMDNFDFEKVHDTMLALDWRWASIGDVPTVEEIEDEAARLLWDVVNADDYDVIATGGLEASKDFSDYNDPFIQLRFTLEEWSESGSEMDKEEDCAQ